LSGANLFGGRDGEESGSDRHDRRDGCDSSPQLLATGHKYLYYYPHLSVSTLIPEKTPAHTDPRHCFRTDKARADAVACPVCRCVSRSGRGGNPAPPVQSDRGFSPCRAPAVYHDREVGCYGMSTWVKVKPKIDNPRFLYGHWWNQMMSDHLYLATRASRTVFRSSVLGATGLSLARQPYRSSSPSCSILTKTPPSINS